MRDIREIAELLDALEGQPTSSLEAQDLDFKEWNRRSTASAFSCQSRPCRTRSSDVRRSGRVHCETPVAIWW